MRYWAAGRAPKIGPVAAQTRFHAQKTTPNATAMTAATTMSTVRQDPVFIAFPPPELPGSGSTGRWRGATSQRPIRRAPEMKEALGGRHLLGLRLVPPRGGPHLEGH